MSSIAIFWKMQILGNFLILFVSLLEFGYFKVYDEDE